MSAKPKPKPKYKAPDTTTWSVIIDGTPAPVTAETFDLATDGSLVFSTDDTIVKAVATGHWSIVEIVPPPEPPEE